MSGGSDADELQGGPGNDRLSGGDGADLLVGGSGIDSLDGGGGDDVLDGGDGNDVFTITGGSDSITGGTGADRFIVPVGSAGDGDVNRIRDFSVADGDTLRFDDLLPRINDPTGFLSVLQFPDGLHFDIDSNGAAPGGVRFTTILEGLDLSAGGTLAAVNLGYSVVHPSSGLSDLLLDFS